jgi:hypothetical protein
MASGAKSNGDRSMGYIQLQTPSLNFNGGKKKGKKKKTVDCVDHVVPSGESNPQCPLTSPSRFGQMRVGDHRDPRGYNPPQYVWVKNGLLHRENVLTR